jgi:exopolyphosphatase/guanosine-5'-triphosphate,3'-diphosphate pyrophosphatase
MAAKEGVTLEQESLVRHRITSPHSDRAQAPQSTLFGALDLGTNNCRLLMATPLGDGFRVVDAYSRTTRLGEGLVASGRLREQAIERTLSALKQCAHRLVRHHVTHVRSVATEACRRASNCGDFVRRVRAETGLSIEIISAEEEARLALAGCAALLDRTRPYALVFDIGGGSTELICVKIADALDGDEVEAFASLPFGVVTLTEHFRAVLNSQEGFTLAVQTVRRLLYPFARHCAMDRLVGSRQVQMLGTSGTVTTLAGIHLDLPRYDRTMVDGVSLALADIRAVSRQLVQCSAAERAAHPCVGERADLVVAGCAILEAICQTWPVDSLMVADRGVREGLLISMMRAARLAAGR